MQFRVDWIVTYRPHPKPTLVGETQDTNIHTHIWKGNNLSETVWLGDSNMTDTLWVLWWSLMKPPGTVLLNIKASQLKPFWQNPVSPSSPMAIKVPEDSHKESTGTPLLQTKRPDKFC